MFIDNEGNVAIAATHNWKFEDTTGYQTCLVKASIDSRLLSIRSTVTASRILTPLGTSIQSLHTAGAPMMPSLMLPSFVFSA